MADLQPTERGITAGTDSGRELTADRYWEVLAQLRAARAEVERLTATDYSMEDHAAAETAATRLRECTCPSDEACVPCGLPSAEEVQR